jgi:hypothetical protein
VREPLADSGDLAEAAAVVAGEMGCSRRAGDRGDRGDLDDAGDETASSVCGLWTTRLTIAVVCGELGPAGDTSDSPLLGPETLLANPPVRPLVPTPNTAAFSLEAWLADKGEDDSRTAVLAPNVEANGLGDGLGIEEVRGAGRSVNLGDLGVEALSPSPRLRAGELASLDPPYLGGTAERGDGVNPGDGAIGDRPDAACARFCCALVSASRLAATLRTLAILTCLRSSATSASKRLTASSSRFNHSAGESCSAACPPAVSSSSSKSGSGSSNRESETGLGRLLFDMLACGHVARSADQRRGCVSPAQRTPTSSMLSSNAAIALWFSAY